MRDGLLRRAVKRVVRADYELGLRLRRARLRRQGRLPFELGGTCRRCAACCEAPAIQVGFATFHLRSLRWLFLWWQRVVNGFELVDRQPAQRLFVFRCTHFDPATRACDSYESRPAMCRDYPRVLLEQAHPAFLPGCGYRAVARNAAGLRRALAEVPLDAERRARLERDLHLE